MSNDPSKVGEENWVNISNVYTPPPNSVGQEIEFDPEKIMADEQSIILGDLNGHSPLWDFALNPDTRSHIRLDHSQQPYSTQ